MYIKLNNIYSYEYLKFVKYRILDSIIKDKNECWIWQKRKCKQGYGQISLCEHGVLKCFLVHRISFFIWNNIDPENQMVLHKCPNGSNTACCNPDHLYLGDQSDNMKDCVREGRKSNGNRKGVNHPLCKLNESDIIKIRECYSSGVSVKSLSKEFNIHLNYVYRILNKTRWSHL